MIGSRMLLLDTVRKTLLGNDRVLSRTIASSRIDNSVNQELKRTVELAKPAMRRLTYQNQLRVVDYISWRGEMSSANSDELFHFLMTIHELTNRGLGVNPIYRTWDIPYWEGSGEQKVALLGIGYSLYSAIAARRSELEATNVEQRLDAISALEWEIGIGPIHPFYDGNGRTSRYFGLLLASMFRSVAVRHSSREEYFAKGRGGVVEFQKYYSRLPRVALHD